MKTVKKGWGNGLWIINTTKYCGKILTFNCSKRCSLHYHLNKDECFYIIEGKFVITLYELEHKEETIQIKVFYPGEAIHIPPKMVHQMMGLERINKLVEFSTHHEDSDSYRIQKGD